jgi:hypothetical protein
MLRRSAICALAATLGITLAACGGSPAFPPESNPTPNASTPATTATGGHNGGGGGLTLPENAPPRVRRAFEKAKAAEDERDRIQARAMEVIREHPPPSLSPGAAPVEPDNPCAEGNGGGTCDPSEACVSDCPSGAAEPPGDVPPPAAVPPTVPPEVREAMNAWAKAQRDRIAACEGAAAEMSNTDDSGIGQLTSPPCTADRLPDDFTKWLAILGYNVNDLLYKGV